MSRFRRGRPAFTLVELIVVLAVLAIVLALCVPAVSGMLARGKSAKCLANLRQIGLGLNLYLADHDQRMPDMKAGRASKNEDAATIDVVLAPYLSGETAVFACPADPVLFRRTGTSYYWNVALNGQSLGGLNFLKLFEAKSSIPVASDKEGWHTGTREKVNFLYADGHTARELQLTTSP